MKKLLAALSLVFAGLVPAMAADVNAPAKPVTKAPAAPSGFFIGGVAGMSATDVNTEFVSVPGTVSGTNLRPAGGTFGINTGFGTNCGGFYCEAMVEANYIFARASGSDAVNSYTTKNGLELRQGVFLGAPWTTFTGALPQMTSLPSTASWPIPFSGPTNISGSALIPGITAGIAERSISATATSLADGAQASATRWMWGPYAGARIDYKITTNWTIGAEYYHTFNESSWTNLGGEGVLGQFKPTDIDTVKFGARYYF